MTSSISQQLCQQWCVCVCVCVCVWKDDCLFKFLYHSPLGLWSSKMVMTLSWRRLKINHPNHFCWRVFFADIMYYSSAKEVMFSSTSAGWFISRIAQNPLNGFPWNLDGGWISTQGQICTVYVPLWKNFWCGTESKLLKNVYFAQYVQTWWLHMWIYSTVKKNVGKASFCKTTQVKTLGLFPY